VASCIYEAKLDSAGSNLLITNAPGGDATELRSTITVDSAGNSHVIGYDVTANQYFLFNFNPNSGFNKVTLSLGGGSQVSPEAIVADPAGNLLIRKSCRVAIYFAPKANGDASDTLLITGNMSNPGSIPLSGAGR